ncbi:tagatose kinase [Tropicimonas isoalkanivorans]|uniref:Sugar or nucleoside kinase, ribokinase family n=1 Tax=Tropicimonas isoalkanivorans TaxID=441112 RepID=A0A1I1DSA2_9RHOB|nr:sugar kinase [Tropicimonas isoalkanivorans]SFB77276.1 Sugar or nucleoside kinase, ribokinase family [Tropicimonas isoalkanivorans]
MKKIVTIGEIVVEIMATELGNGFLEPIPLVGPFPSGAPAIFIDQVARLDQPCGIVSCVGNDDFGKLNIDRLKADGVDTSAIRVIPEYATGSAFVRYREDGNRDFVFNIKQSANGQIGPAPEVDALFDSADCLHVMGSALFCEGSVKLSLQAAEVIKAKGGLVTFDPNLRKEMLDLPGMREAMQEILSKTDLFLPSGPELSLLTEAKDDVGAIAELLSRGVTAIVLKQGSEGASYIDARGRIDQPAFAVEEIDPTGAGDSFGGAFVTCWLRGEDPAASLRFAAAAGALAVTRKGPMEGTSRRAEIEAFLTERA